MSAMSERIQTIHSMLLSSPDDVFLHYSLAMEYATAGQYDKAVASFKRCIELDSQYLPAYVEAGKALRAAGDLAAAREAFAEGLDLATRKGDSHTRDFIRQQLEALPRDP